ncbi:MAG: hypothetical protein RR177_06090 [Oscillospiraceae bacterium]
MKVDLSVVMQTLDLMWKGVLGIFVVLSIIAVVVWLLSLTDRKKK